MLKICPLATNNESNYSQLNNNKRKIIYLLVRLKEKYTNSELRNKKTKGTPNQIPLLGTEKNIKITFASRRKWKSLNSKKR